MTEMEATASISVNRTVDGSLTLEKSVCIKGQPLFKLIFYLPGNRQPFGRLRRKRQLPPQSLINNLTLLGPRAAARLTNKSFIFRPGVSLSGDKYNKILYHINGIKETRRVYRGKILQKP